VRAGSGGDPTQGDAVIYIQPVTQAAAKEFVLKHHRHHHPPLGSVFQVAIGDLDRNLVGVAIVGRPVSRHLDDGSTLEITRLCVLPGVRNGCSLLYGAAARIGAEMGYARIITYTLPSEGGASLRAAGWQEAGDSGGGAWSRPWSAPQLFPAICEPNTEVKTKWVKVLSAV